MSFLYCLDLKALLGVILDILTYYKVIWLQHSGRAFIFSRHHSFVSTKCIDSLQHISSNGFQIIILHCQGLSISHSQVFKNLLYLLSSTCSSVSVLDLVHIQTFWGIRIGIVFDNSIPFNHDSEQSIDPPGKAFHLSPLLFLCRLFEENGSKKSLIKYVIK